ncbi:hypothetical protein [Thermomonospora amylolytica]|uniref:hypothetical protein n=1 Tax=Thermomonospora amylolytica TaxID=1411117 RepID=UPI000E6C0035|nr:hypothetical protein [Thermomonospora amylolytica]
MSWQAAGPGPGTGTDDPFSTVEAEVRAMVSAPWWAAAPPMQRAEAITSRMLAGAGEWWLFGAWGRWYRCGLDGGWQPCPPPSDPSARRRVFTAPRGAGNPPVPPQLLPTGPDLAAGPVATAALLGPPPDPAVVARIEQIQINALGVNAAQFALADPTFQPHTPSTLAAAWGALLWCAGAPVTLDEHPLVRLFAAYLTTPADRLRWMTPPDLATLVGYYTGRLVAGDWAGATAIARVMHDVAAALRADARFSPGADALAAITAASLPLVQHDMAAARYGPAAVLTEWRRRCPAEHALPMVRDASPGEFLRLALYDLQLLVVRLTGRPMDHGEVRRAAAALLAADLHAAPAAVHAVLPWLDGDGARTVQAVLTDPQHPGRRLWPRDGRLPDELRAGDATALQDLLATAYTLGLTWCRLAGGPPPPTGFAVAAAAAAALADGPPAAPRGTGELTPWQIIEAARAHMASERAAAPVPPPVPPADQTPPPPPVAEPRHTPPPGVPPAAETAVAGPDAFQPAPPPAHDPAGGRPDPYDRMPPPGPAADQDAYQPYPPYPPPPGEAPGGGTGGSDAFGHAQPSAGAAEGEGFPRIPPPPPPSSPPDPWGSGQGGASPAAFAHDGPQAPQVPPGAEPAQPAEPFPPPADATVAEQPSWQAGEAPPTTRYRMADNPPPAPSSSASSPSSAVPPGPAAGRPDLEGVRIAEAYGIRFLCGEEDVERLLSEVRRRGKWAQRLRGQEVSSASMPALLLVGEPSTGQRRLGRMVAKALAEVEVSSGRLHGLHADELRDRGPDGLRAVLAEHSGHALLLEGLDRLLLDDAAGPAYATALYRARAEGVSDTALLATCAPDRRADLAAAAPEVVTDLRAVRMPDLADPTLRRALLALLADERRLVLNADAWRIVERDLPGLRGRGRLTGARLIEAYLDHACNRNLGRAVATQAIGDAGALELTGADFEGLAAELSGP